MKTALIIVFLVISVILAVIVMMQEGKGGLSGAISGGQETFFGSNKATGIEAVLANLTKIFAIVFVLDSLFLVLLG